jgi:hypothetical protein
VVWCYVNHDMGRIIIIDYDYLKIFPSESSGITLLSHSVLDSRLIDTASHNNQANKHSERMLVLVLIAFSLIYKRISCVCVFSLSVFND